MAILNPYSKTTYVNGTTPDLNAVNLNKNEQGVYDVTEKVRELAAYETNAAASAVSAASSASSALNSANLAAASVADYTGVVEDVADLTTDLSDLTTVVANKEFRVGATRTGTNTFTTLKECTEHIESNFILNATVYVDDGDYDLVEEYGQAYLDAIVTSASFGLTLGCNTHYIFSQNAKILFNYAGTNADVGEFFSPFNIVGSFTLENANIEVTNCRYCVHEDVLTIVPLGIENYIAKYINCVMKHNGNTIAGWVGTVCIGAGTSKNSLSIIDGGKYTCGTQYPYAISYHNHTGSDISRIIFKNVWVNNAIRLGNFGDSIVNVEMSNCFTPNNCIIENKFNVTRWADNQRYSTTEEVVIGTYDGKNLYRKALIVPSLPSTAGSDVPFAHGIANVDKIMISKDSYAKQGAYYLPLPFIYNPTTSQIYILLDATNVYIKVGVNQSGTSAVIWLEYTKTTD